LVISTHKLDTAAAVNIADIFECLIILNYAWRFHMQLRRSFKQDYGKHKVNIYIFIASIPNEQQKDQRQKRKVESDDEASLVRSCSPQV
jgi:hypothetical protein